MVYSALKGRIGNNLFQIAAGISLANKNSTDFAAYIPVIKLPEPDNCYLKEYLNQFRGNLLRNIVLLDELPIDSMKYEESQFNYTPVLYHDNICLNGYFQSEKYFNKKLVRDVFSIDDQSLRYIKNKFEFLSEEEFTSINIRRGDLLKNPQFIPVCSLKYYKNAINYLGNNKNYLIISDDIKWCKKNFIKGNFYFIEDEPPVIDLYLQSFCTNNIISNSSFSWWGAWLNPNSDKIIIAPVENWVGKFYHYFNTKDLLPDSWVKLPNPIAQNVRLRLFIVELLQILVTIKKFIKRKLFSIN